MSKLDRYLHVSSADSQQYSTSHLIQKYYISVKSYVKRLIFVYGGLFSIGMVGVSYHLYPKST